MFFLVRDGRYLPAHPHSFRDLMEGRVAGEEASEKDWETHLTTLFPDVRLKRFIEVRGADAVPSDMTCALPALWKGILYDAEALARTWELVSGWSLAEREEATDAVARRGLAANLPGGSARQMASDLLAIASEGLRRIGHGGSNDPDERRFLDPLQEILESGRSPGEETLVRFQGEWQGRIPELIEHARY
jgi:glutamate--cysteine ligase